MARLEWREPDGRYYQSGLDRGVFYPMGSGGPDPDDPEVTLVGVPWDGLVSVTENSNREIKAFFQDGIKYLDHEVRGGFSGKLTAFTYPEEFDKTQGIAEYGKGTVDVAPGVFVHDQPSLPFDLSYRTLINGQTEELGYELHLLWRIRAVPDDIQRATIDSQVSPILFGWTLSSAVPWTYENMQPTQHITVDSRKTNPVALAWLEDQLYGTVGDLPQMPDLDTVLTNIRDLTYLNP